MANPIRVRILARCIAKEILGRWDDLDGKAGQTAQIEQDAQAYTDMMISQLENLIADRINKAENAGLT